MKRTNLSLLIISFVAITVTNNVFAQDNIIERLGIPGPIKFDGVNYKLARTSKPNDITYSQDYLPENVASDNYSQMIICKLFVCNWTVQEVAEQKMRQIDESKKTDSISTSRLFKSPDGKEFLVDYFIGEYTKDNKLSGVKYVVYRYKRIKLQNDSDAVFSYVFTKGSNGKNPENFLKELNSEKNDYINKMSSAELPTIKLQPPTLSYIKDPTKEKGYTSEFKPSQEIGKSNFLEGASLNKNHQYAQAIEKFKKALAIDSTGNCGTGMNGAAYGELGDCYSNIGDYSNAMMYFDKGIQINKYYALTYLHKANLFSKQHKKDEAIKTLDALISNNSNEPMAYAQRGLLYDSTQAEMALMDYNACLKLIKDQNQEEPLKQMVKVIEEKRSEIEKRLKK